MHRAVFALSILAACGRTEPLTPRVTSGDAGRMRPDSGVKPMPDGGVVECAALRRDAGSRQPGCHGYTWTVRGQQGDIVLVGSDAQSNAYVGDTDCMNVLPILCVNDEGLPQPPSFTISSYSGWFPGEVATSTPMQGSELVSREYADCLCAGQLGPGWRMAEHHDGQGHVGWGFGALGSIPAGTRFWAAINDQPANPWNYP